MNITVINGTEKNGVTYRLQEMFLADFSDNANITEMCIRDSTWQHEMLAYRDEKKKPYSQTYLKTLHNQLSAIFNHAVRYYELRSNPAAKVGNCLLYTSHTVV